MPIVSISLTRELLKRLEAAIRDKGYSSRSEAVRDALRASLSEYELSRFEKGRVATTITVISDYERRDVDERLTRLRHDHDDLVTSNLHLHIGKEYCLEVFIVQGELKEVHDFITRIKALKGIQEVKYTLTPIAGEAD